MEKLRIKIMTLIVVAITLLALCHVVEWKYLIICGGVLLIYEALILAQLNYYKIMDMINVKRLRKYDGKEYEAVISGVKVSGKISVQESGKTWFAYLCFNEDLQGAAYIDLKEKHGYKHAWFVAFLNADSLKIAGVKKLTIKK